MGEGEQGIHSLKKTGAYGEPVSGGRERRVRMGRPHPPLCVLRLSPPQGALRPTGRCPPGCHSTFLPCLFPALAAFPPPSAPGQSLLQVVKQSRAKPWPRIPRTPARPLRTSWPFPSAPRESLSLPGDNSPTLHHGPSPRRDCRPPLSWEALPGALLLLPSCPPPGARHAHLPRNLPDIGDTAARLAPAYASGPAHAASLPRRLGASRVRARLPSLLPPRDFLALSLADSIHLFPADRRALSSAARGASLHWGTP